MTSAAEALGMTLPWDGSISVVDPTRYPMVAPAAGASSAWSQDLPPDRSSPARLSRRGGHLLALGGSTNAFIHLVAIAARPASTCPR